MISAQRGSAPSHGLEARRRRLRLGGGIPHGASRCPSAWRLRSHGPLDLLLRLGFGRRRRAWGGREESSEREPEVARCVRVRFVPERVFAAPPFWGGLGRLRSHRGVRPPNSMRAEVPARRTSVKPCNPLFGGDRQHPRAWKVHNSRAMCRIRCARSASLQRRGTVYNGARFARELSSSDRASHEVEIRDGSARYSGGSLGGTWARSGSQEPGSSRASDPHGMRVSGGGRRR